jgi:hypothetical protein
MAQTPIILRRSPFVMLKQIIILEVGLGFFYMIPTLLERYGIISLSDAHLFHSNLVIGIGIIVIQILVISLVFVRWYLTTYYINGTKVIIKENFLNKREENFKSEYITSIILVQNLFNKIFRTAHLVAKDNKGNVLFVLKNIAEPALQLSLIEQLQDKKNPDEKIECAKGTIKDIIKNGESQCVEFKASLLWDMKKKSPNKDIQHAIMKTITGFMNTQGGTLLIGVNDKKEVVGLENDLKNIKKKNLDGFENFFNIIFTNMIGLEFRKNVEVTFKKVNKKDICVINVKASKKPVYLKDSKNESFYIRAGNATHPLKISEATRYIEDNFKE